MGIRYLNSLFFSLSAAGLDYYGNPENDPIHPSEIGRKLSFYFTDTNYLTLYFGVLVIIFAFYVFAFRLGRTKSLQDFREVSSPPFDLSPAAIRFIENMGFDPQCLVVGVLNASVKGCYRIKWGKKGFLAVKQEQADFSRLTNDEKSALSFRKNHYWDKVHVAGSYSNQTRKMGKRMHFFLKKRYGSLFRTKLPWSIAGIGLSVALSFLLFGLPQEGRFLGGLFAYLIVAAIFVIFPLVFMRIAIRDKYWYGVIMCAFFLLAGVGGIYLLESRSIGPYMTPVLLPIVALNYLFYKKLPMYTRIGQSVMREVRAYKTYLAKNFSPQAEGEIENQETDVRELPYAMAMDLELGSDAYFNRILTDTQYEPYQIFNTLYRK